MPKPASRDHVPTAPAALERTPLHGLHVELGARMVPFAGYEMPVQYPTGIIKEHLHTREAASLFDVSHMGQARLSGAESAGALEALVPGDIHALESGRMRYTMLTTESGGILDDVMVTASDDGLLLVLNAARKAVDLEHIAAHLPDGVALRALTDRALLALQGPAAARVLARVAPGIEDMRFLSARPVRLAGAECLLSRSGYTGEDGFEISVPTDAAEGLARALLAEGEAAPAGLGARDTLRLEAGLCLYGHDIDETTSPVEAALAWAIGKRRRTEGGFLGAGRILAELEDGPARKRVGIRPEGRAPAREGTPIRTLDGREIGTVTSGGFGPTAGGPIAMGYVAADFAATGTEVMLEVRRRDLPGRVADLPFVPHRYFRG